MKDAGPTSSVRLSRHDASQGNGPHLWKSVVRKGYPSDSARSWNDLRRIARLRLLRMHYESGVGHIGGNLSCLDLMLVLHHEILGPADQFVLSKGHSAGAYYITLWTLGRLTDDDLRPVPQGWHAVERPPAGLGIDDILFATGSLGHGLSLAAGLALAKRLKGEPGPRLLPDVRRRMERRLVLGGADLRPSSRARQPDDRGGPERAAGFRHDA